MRRGDVAVTVVDLISGRLVIREAKKASIDSIKCYCFGCKTAEDDAKSKANSIQAH